MAGRKPKLPGTHQRHMTQEEQAIQEDNKRKLSEFAPLEFERVPQQLSKRERKEWKRLAEDLAGLPLTELDRNLLISYCSWWSVFLEAKENRDEFGVLVQEERNGYLITKRNPAIDLMATANREIKAIAGDLGLTLNSRLQLVNAKNKDEDYEDDEFNL